MKIHDCSHLIVREQQAIEKLVSTLLQEDGDPILNILLFGSKARGDDTSDSDIDVLVVTGSDEWPLKHRILTHGSRLSLEYDVLFNVYVIDKERWAWMRRVQHPLYRNVVRNGIDLIANAGASLTRNKL